MFSAILVKPEGLTPVSPKRRKHAAWPSWSPTTLAAYLLLACLGTAQAQVQIPTAQQVATAAGQEADILNIQTDGNAELPSFVQVQQTWQSSARWLLDRTGTRIQRIRTDFNARRGDWVALADVSPALLHAVLLTEDKHFYEHSGVDWGAVGAAAWGNLWNERTRGASTITMQLAGLLHENLRARAGGRSWGQKWRQLWLSRELEDTWSKAQILEAYLNLVPFRGEIIGIDALSRSLFNKAAHGLDMREAAIAAALLRAPNASVARLSERACQVLQQAQSPWGNDCKAVALFTEAALRNRHYDAESGIAPHFARYAMRQWSAAHPNTQLPEQLPSTLDARIQTHALHSLQLHLNALQGRNVQDGAAIVLDNATGNVLAWVGSSGQALSQADQVDSVLAMRQPGSTLKPFLYAQALAEHRLTAASLLNDSPAKIPTQYGIYAPENYDQGYKGWVSVRQALGSSLNIPAVRTLLMVSPEAFSAQLRLLGFSLPEPSGYYGYSLALGGVDVSLLQLTNAYRSFANGGLRSDVHTHNRSFAKHPFRPRNTKRTSRTRLARKRRFPCG
ncbi:transglycosylase domain-containing protein [Lampropedia puyangensis]|uniref:transglycosylase domain-containing protein n=1 Tax=Lampropedia puyangensis TaxID=1330072 RepID=UPI001FCE91E4|nr:transglycosylase domain-containing protein [Lampropedia puyangensis]